MTVVPACMCRPIIKFSQAVYIINPDFHLVLAGYQPAWIMWYIALIPQAVVLCLIYTHTPSDLRPLGLCVYIRQSTTACGICITYMCTYHFDTSDQRLYITYNPDHRAISIDIALWLGQNLISLCSQGYTWHHPGLYRANSLRVQAYY